MNYLEDNFSEEMKEIYNKAKGKCNYNSNIFLSMLTEDGGLKKAKILLYSNKFNMDLLNCGDVVT